jgi:hypothetical protein
MNINTFPHPYVKTTCGESDERSSHGTSESQMTADLRATMSQRIVSRSLLQICAFATIAEVCSGDIFSRNLRNLRQQHLYEICTLGLFSISNPEFYTVHFLALMRIVPIGLSRRSHY